MEPKANGKFWMGRHDTTGEMSEMMEGRGQEEVADIPWLPWPAGGHVAGLDDSK